MIVIMFVFVPLCFSQSVQEEYIRKYCQIAVEEMGRTGVPASITLAQGILESGSGTSQLSIKGNNHFGIKCHSDWTGGKMYSDDDAKNDQDQNPDPAPEEPAGNGESNTTNDTNYMQSYS